MRAQLEDIWLDIWVWLLIMENPEEAHKKLGADSPLMYEEAQKSNKGWGRGFICQSWGFCDDLSLSLMGQSQGICQYCHISGRKKKEALRQKWNMSAPVPTP